jgi:hypothetical protein
VPPEPSFVCEGDCGTACSCPGFPYTCSDGCYQTDCATEEGMAAWGIILLVLGILAALSLVVKCLKACCGGPGAIETPTIALVEQK